MNRTVRFSAVPVGEQIEVNGLVYTKSSHGYSYRLNGTGPRISVKKHQAVIWVNAYKTVED